MNAPKIEAIDRAKKRFCGAVCIIVIVALLATIIELVYKPIPIQALKALLPF